MDGRPPDDDILNRAFQLAYFIHRDQATAVRIVAGALAKLRGAATAQEKRFYYRPRPRPNSAVGSDDDSRTKVSLAAPHLLQRLIYAESELYELVSEQSGRTLTEEDMIVRFVKFLVQITWERNSFYVTLGIGRLLYNYSTAETVRLYEFLMDDPERAREDHYYRSRKAFLIGQLMDRFGKSIAVCRSSRGETRIRALEYPDRHAALVLDCLDRLAPWKTPCVMLKGFMAVGAGLAGLTPRSGVLIDGLQRSELQRMHAILHPDCLRRLTGILGLDSPDLRLEVPQFSIASHRQGVTLPDRRQLPRLGIAELTAIRGLIRQPTVRRNRDLKIASL